MSTRNRSQIDDTSAELLVVVSFDKVRRRAARLIAQVDPTLHEMCRLVEVLMDRKQHLNAAQALVAFYEEGAASAARRMRLIAHDTQGLRLVQSLIDEIHQHR